MWENSYIQFKMRDSRPRSTLGSTLTTIHEVIEEEGPLERFDNSKTLVLGFGEFTCIVQDRTTLSTHILQYCDSKDWSEGCSRVVELGKTNSCLVSTHFTFRNEGRVYVGSQIADMCLADIIFCTLPINEEEASVVIRQVSGSLPKMRHAEDTNTDNICFVETSRTGHSV